MLDRLAASGSGSARSSPTPPTSCAARWPPCAPSSRSPSVSARAASCPPTCSPTCTGSPGLVEDLLLLARAGADDARTVPARVLRRPARCSVRWPAGTPPRGCPVSVADGPAVFVLGGPRRAAAGAVQPRGQRGAARVDPGGAGGRGLGGPGAADGDRRRAGRSRRPTGSGSSTGSPGSTTPAPATPAAPASAWPSSASCSAGPAEPSPSPRRPRRAPRRRRRPRALGCGPRCACHAEVPPHGARGSRPPGRRTTHRASFPHDCLRARRHRRP